MGSSTLVGSTTRPGAAGESASRTMCAPLPLPLPGGGAGGGGCVDFSGFGFLDLLMGQILFRSATGTKHADRRRRRKAIPSRLGGRGRARPYFGFNAQDRARDLDRLR